MPSKKTKKDTAIPVSCKASFSLSPDKVINSQLNVSRKNEDKVDLLIWLYMGFELRERKYSQNVAFLNGAGCCNGLALDMFIFTKKLLSQNNKS